jgi:hypothetical protein
MFFSSMLLHIPGFTNSLPTIALDTAAAVDALVPGTHIVTGMPPQIYVCHFPHQELQTA